MLTLAFKDFSTQYQALLQRFLSGGGEDALHKAYELGHKALADGIGLLDMTYVHENALSKVLEENKNSEEFLNNVRAGGRFLDEALSPFEVSRLSSKDANTALRKLYEVLEEEAKRIAHVLHDESGQLLAMIYLELAEFARESPQEDAERLNQVVGYLDEVREQLRTLSHELRPMILDQLGLIPALQFLSKNMIKRTGLQIEIKDETNGRLPQPIETVLYRTVQEALMNISRHAMAEHVEIKLWIHSDKVYCVIRDDGIGFAMPYEGKRMFKGLGLVGINERVSSLDGECKIMSKPGEGTEIQVKIPL